jgi:hypothetical protein
MSSYRQIEAHRRNAQRSTGPKTHAGKRSSRCNALRHGLTAETVIGALEDAEDYKAFDAAITADYDAQSAVERELVLRFSQPAVAAATCNDDETIRTTSIHCGAIVRGGAGYHPISLFSVGEPTPARAGEKRGVFLCARNEIGGPTLPWSLCTGCR